MVNINDIYFSNFRLIYSCDRGFTNALDISLKHFGLLEGIVKDYFCSNYSEMDFGTRGIEGAILKHGTIFFES